MTSLRNIGAIAQKEWRHYFGSPIAYVALFVWALLFGIFFRLGLYFFVQMSMAGSQMEFGARRLSLNEYLIRPLFHNMTVVAVLLIPLLTMRLFAEEKRQGTIELLATSPLTDLEIILGKFLAAVGLYALMILTSLVDISMVWRYATQPPEWKPVATGALVLLLMGAGFIAIGLFISTLTRNQIVAGIISFCVFLGIFTLGWADDPSGGAVSKVLAYMGLTQHMDDMLKGVFDLKDVVFYLSYIVFGIFLSQQSLESQRWRA